MIPGAAAVGSWAALTIVQLIEVPLLTPLIPQFVPRVPTAPQTETSLRPQVFNTERQPVLLPTRPERPPRSPVAPQPSAAPAVPTKPALPFFVYSDCTGEQPLSTSGWMGYNDAIELDDAWEENPHSGSTCVRLAYNATYFWGGGVWQNPPNNWGDTDGGYDLSDAKELIADRLRIRLRRRRRGHSADHLPRRHGISLKRDRNACSSQEDGAVGSSFCDSSFLIQKVVSTKNLRASTVQQDLAVWRKRNASERIDAVELLRRQAHGSATRLQRTARIVQRARD